MQVTLIKHSSVLIELDNHSLLFDNTSENIEVNKDKPLYIFHSHRHYDHYDKNTFNINHPSKKYILSDDIKVNKNALMVTYHKSYTLDDIVIKTLKSTDEGVAFIIEVENKTIYFAGDLHYWHWNDERAIKQYHNYLNEIKLLKDYYFDLACVVVDKRLEDRYLYGLNLFMENCTFNKILPIHYFENYEISKQLKKDLDDPSLIYPLYNNFKVEI